MALWALWAFALSLAGVRPSAARAPAATDPDVPMSHPVRVFFRSSPEPQPCVDEATMRERVTAALRRTVFFPRESSDVILMVRPTSEHGVALQLLDTDERDLGTRFLRAESCAELRELLSFSLSVMIDFRTDEVAERRNAARLAADASGAVGEPKPPPQAEEPARPRPTEAAPATKDTESKSTPVFRGGERPPLEPAWALHSEVGPFAQTGLGPLPVAGAYLLGSIQRDRFSGTLRVNGGWMPSVARRGGELGAWHVGGSVGGCWGSDDGSEWRGRACLGVTSGLVSVTASGFREERQTTFGEIGLEPTVAVGAPALGLPWTIGFGAVVPLLRSDWHARGADGETALFRAPAVRFVGFLGVRFGGSEISRRGRNKPSGSRPLSDQAARHAPSLRTSQRRATPHDG